MQTTALRESPPLFTRLVSTVTAPKSSEQEGAAWSTPLPLLDSHLAGTTALYYLPVDSVGIACVVVFSAGSARGAVVSSAGAADRGFGCVTIRRSEARVPLLEVCMRVRTRWERVGRVIL